MPQNSLNVSYFLCSLTLFSLLSFCFPKNKRQRKKKFPHPYNGAKIFFLHFINICMRCVNRAHLQQRQKKSVYLVKAMNKMGRQVRECCGFVNNQKMQCTFIAHIQSNY